jgi:hypothetical protein
MLTLNAPEKGAVALASPLSPASDVGGNGALRIRKLFRWLQRILAALALLFVG